MTASAGLSGSVTTQTFPLVTLPSTAVTGTRSAPVALPASMPIVTGSPGKTFWSEAIGHRTSTVVPSPVVVEVEPSAEVVVVDGAFVPMVSPLQVKGAGPPSMDREAEVGALTNWYCCAAVIVPLAE